MTESAAPSSSGVSATNMPGTPSPDRIASLPVSEDWKLKFHLIAEAGGPGLPGNKTLRTSERMKIGFNIVAFLFGPFYYVVKGMWKKGLSLFAACFLVLMVVGTVLDILGMGRIANALGYGMAAVFAVRANIDYYKKMVLGRNGWW